MRRLISKMGRLLKPPFKKAQTQNSIDSVSNTTMSGTNSSVGTQCEDCTQTESRKTKKATPRRRNPSASSGEDETQTESRKKKKATRQRQNPQAISGKTIKENRNDLKSSLRQFALSTVKKGVNSLVKEFADLKKSTSVPPAKTAFEANTDKNRYRDVFCIDKTRVVLTWPPDSTNDYIHANYVSIKGEKRFICTQGPTKKTVDDFWRMAWEQKCRAIVMLCNVTEQGKKKCEQYWPDKLNDSITTASNVTIKNVGSLEAENILTITSLKVTADGETILIKHYLWNAWPDHGAPQNTTACLRLLAQLKAYSPVIVHCSAGIGRTGTIVGLEMALQAINNNEPLSMFNVVKELRSYRHGSVQTDVQYVYMHRVMLGLAESKKVVSQQELALFFTEYEAFLKSRRC